MTFIMFIALLNFFFTIKNYLHIPYSSFHALNHSYNNNEEEEEEVIRIIIIINESRVVNTHTHTHIHSTSSFVRSFVRSSFEKIHSKQRNGRSSRRNRDG
jgi:hypothetical protein